MKKIIIFFLIACALSSLAFAKDKTDDTPKIKTEKVSDPKTLPDQVPDFVSDLMPDAKPDPEPEPEPEPDP